jgi:hypothetical protein
MVDMLLSAAEHHHASNYQQISNAPRRESRITQMSHPARSPSL